MGSTTAASGSWSKSPGGEAAPVAEGKQPGAETPQAEVRTADSAPRLDGADLWDFGRQQSCTAGGEGNRQTKGSPCPAWSRLRAALAVAVPLTGR
jgi:hypothetical protein